MENNVEILEGNEMFFMPDIFTGNTLIFETGPDKSASITIRSKFGDTSVCLWPNDLSKLKEFLNQF